MNNPSLTSKNLHQWVRNLPIGHLQLSDRPPDLRRTCSTIGELFDAVERGALSRSSPTAVARIIADVKKKGDRALSALTKRYDGVALIPRRFRVTAQEIDRARIAAVNRFGELFADRVSDVAANVKFFSGGKTYGKHLRVEFKLPGKVKKGAGQILGLGHSDTVYPLGTLRSTPFRADAAVDASFVHPPRDQLEPQRRQLAARVADHPEPEPAPAQLGQRRDCVRTGHEQAPQPASAAGTGRRCLPERAPFRGGREGAVLDAAGPDEPVGDLLQGPGGPAEDKDLEAVVGVQVDVEGGDDRFVVGVLEVGQLVGQIARVVVVDECDRPDSLLRAELPLIPDEGFADEITEGLGPVGVPFAYDEPIELPEELFVERDAEPGDLPHARSLPPVYFPSFSGTANSRPQ